MNIKKEVTSPPITKMLHLSPMSKGGSGKSTEGEMRVSYLSARGFGWLGSDMDGRHKTFSKRHPKRVKIHQSEAPLEAKEAFAAIFRSVMRDSIPIHVVDCRAQADQLFINAINEFDFLTLCKSHGICVTISLFPSDELESLTNMQALVKATAGEVNFVIVENKARNDTRLFSDSSFEKFLMSHGAKKIRMPVIMPSTMLAMEKVENHERRGIPFAEFATVGRSLLDPIMAGELGMALANMYRQYDSIAELLLPPEFAKKVKTDVSEGDIELEADDGAFALNFPA